MKRCIQCDVEFPAPIRLRGRPRKFCSKVCSGRFYQAQKPKVERLERICSICGTHFVTNKKSHVFCSYVCRVENNLSKASWPRVWNRELNRFESTCQECNAEVFKTTPFGKVIRCDACRGKALSALNRLKNTKRRKAHAGNRITVEILAIRDGNKCYLCDQPIDFDIARNMPMGAVIDHVLPIAKGGMDTWDNVKLAHWVCNAKKSDKIIEGINA